MGPALHDKAELHAVVTRRVTRCPGTTVHIHRHTSSYEGKKKYVWMPVYERDRKKTKEFSKYIGTGGYLRHLTSSIIGTPDVIYEVSYKCGPYHAGGEGKEAKKTAKGRKTRKEFTPKG